MTTDIYFYSGTGNSLWTARRLAEELGNTTLHPISKIDTPVSGAPDGAVGLVFPVHMWGVPHKVLRFIDFLAEDTPNYFFAVAVNAGQVAATLLQLRKVMSMKGLTLSAGYDLVMPSNYIPWGGPGAEEKWRPKIDTANEKIRRIAREVAQKTMKPMDKGPLWQNILFSWLYGISFKRVAQMDKSFHADEKCNSCGICAKVCPAENIEIAEGKPRWLHRCEQCLACIQWCPREAIQYGKKTAMYKRYHHPEVALGDILACAPGSGK
ncbi:EFR1 family ferrodoxin [bacterium]|nr:EFR1 family ferrodoxin [bacterium]